MPYLKVVKNNAYYKRFQVKFRRRRECKTDYHARRALITQDKTKHYSPKYRLVVRLSNADVTCQIAYSTLTSDVIMCAAYSHELSKYGAKIYEKGGQKNYAAAYATGLLLARRVLTKLGLDQTYEGQTAPDGKDFNVKKEKHIKNRPFKVFLDIGLHYTTTGARVFGAMKGAVDGGLSIPHKNKRFPGYNPSNKKFDSRVLRKYIFGGHVAEYMRLLQANDPDKYAAHFSKYIAAGVGPDDVEKMWASVHAAIRKDPVFVKQDKDIQPRPNKKQKKKTLAERKASVAAKIAEAGVMTQ